MIVKKIKVYRQTTNFSYIISSFNKINSIHVQRKKKSKKTQKPEREENANFTV